LNKALLDCPIYATEAEKRGTRIVSSYEENVMSRSNLPHQSVTPRNSRARVSALLGILLLGAAASLRAQNDPG
jgi:hypothetical protein